jgi:hypothetical protein
MSTRQSDLTYCKTPVACRILGVPYDTVMNAIRRGRLEPPQKDSSNDYIWTQEDIDRAREFLKSRKRRRQGVVT